MRTLMLVVITVLTTVFSHAQEVDDSFVRPLPLPAKAVVDFARLLTKKQFNTLAKDLKTYQQQTTNAIVVLTLESLTDPATDVEYSLEAAATAYFNTWGIGDSVKNNGVLILVVPSLRKVRIEVGTGLENVLTNDECAQIIREQIVPPFKEQQYYQGLVEAVAAIKRKLDNDTQASADSATAETATPASYETPAYEPGFVAIDSTPNNTFLFVAFVGLFIIGIFIFTIVKGASGNGGLYTRNGYHIDDHDRWNDNRNRRSRSSYASSTDDSSSSSSDSYRGGNSSGGGASGSW